MIKIIHVILIILVVWLYNLPVYGSTWQPNLTFVWPEATDSLYPVEFYTDHYRWPYSPDKPYNHQVERALRFEYFIHEVQAIQQQTPGFVATPEPGTFLLMASGLGVLILRKKKK